MKSWDGPVDEAIILSLNARHNATYIVHEETLILDLMFNIIDMGKIIYSIILWVIECMITEIIYLQHVGQ